MAAGGTAGHVLEVVRRGDEARRRVREAQRGGQLVGFVPTMGALHAGHLSLVERARRECPFTVVSIFVNPTQFGPHEDFAQYPRTWEADLASLRQSGVDMVFAPDTDEMYARGSSTFVDPPRVAAMWEGQCRPGHFRGVATVVLKLFQLVPADVAYFGQKDYQQVRVVQQMAADLNVPVRIVACPTVRDADGLALSSRNRYLSADERQRALGIVRGLRHVAGLFRGGERSGTALRQALVAVLHGAGIREIDYATIVAADSLVELEQVSGPAVAIVACRVGSTRLIDNLNLE